MTREFCLSAWTLAFSTSIFSEAAESKWKEMSLVAIHNRQQPMPLNHVLWTVSLLPLGGKLMLGRHLFLISASGPMEFPGLGQPFLGGGAPESGTKAVSTADEHPPPSYPQSLRGTIVPTVCYVRAFACFPSPSACCHPSSWCSAVVSWLPPSVPARSAYTLAVPSG